MPEILKTPIDSFLALVREKKSVQLPEAASALGESEDTVEKWALTLDRKGLLKLIYPENPFDKPVVKAVAGEEGGKK